MPFDLPNTASTLSPFFSPGEDLRYFPTTEGSISTVGDYRITTNFDSDSISEVPRSLSFDGYDTLNSLKITGSTSADTMNVFVQSQELRLDFQKPETNSYYSNFRTEVVKSIAEIITKFPYAVYVSSGTTSANTLYDFSNSFNLTTNAVTSNFKIPVSSIVNEGNVLFNSGISFNDNSLFTNFNDYVVQLKNGNDIETGSTVTKLPIVGYSFVAGSHIELTVQGDFLSGQTSGSSSTEFYIAPSPKKVYQFKKDLTPLQNQVLYIGKYKTANPLLNDGSTVTVTYAWPKTIDGFNPDSRGFTFNNWKDDLLRFADSLDCDKTNIMAQTMIPDSYYDFDSDLDIFKNMAQSHAVEFDIIKQYIDGLVFAHTITYDGTENLPDKFIFKLSKLLGFDLSPQFNEVDLLKYLSGDEDDQNNSPQYYNLQLWRRILTNIIWLFKRKGTREALLWIFKLIGAPECMIKLDEIVYDIQSASASGSTGTLLENELSFKVKTNGYPDYDVSPFIFQEGGKGRGNGMKYIDYWRPEFDPTLRIDNVKTQSGNTVYFGTENIINSKQLYCALDPAQAIECNVHEWYQLTGVVWNWCYTDIQLCEWDYPFQWIPSDPHAVVPTGATDHISGMTFQEYMDYLFTNTVDPTVRKTNDQGHTTFYYPQLKNVYLNYMYLSQPKSDRITMSKLENFVKLIERKFFNYGQQLIPATTILLGQGVIYRNTEFHRERFVYKDGIDKGSEFRVDISQPEPVIDLVEVSSEVDQIIEADYTFIEITNEVNEDIEGNCNLIDVSNEIIVEIEGSINSYNIVVEITDEGSDFEEVSDVSSGDLLEDLSNILTSG